MMPAGQWLAAVLESTLAVSDELADSLGVDVALIVFAGEAERRVAGFFLQAFVLEGVQNFV